MLHMDLTSLFREALQCLTDANFMIINHFCSISGFIWEFEADTNTTLLY